VCPCRYCSLLEVLKVTVTILPARGGPGFKPEALQA